MGHRAGHVELVLHPDRHAVQWAAQTTGLRLRGEGSRLRQNRIAVEPAPGLDSLIERVGPRQVRLDDLGGRQLAARDAGGKVGDREARDVRSGEFGQESPPP